MNQSGDSLAIALADLIERHCAQFVRQFPSGVVAFEESRAARDMSTQRRGPAGPWTQMPLRTYLSVGSMRLNVALDHIRALGTLIVPPLTLYSWATVARTAVESSARARWLFAPSISVKLRVRRSQAEQMENVTRSETLLEGTDAKYPADDIRSSILQEARDLGLPEPGGLITSADAIRQLFADPLLPQMDSAAATRIWHYLSGATHGALYFATARFRDSGDGPDEFTRTLNPDVSFPILLAVVRAALDAHSVAVGRAMEYAGSTNPRQWVAWMAQMQQELSAMMPAIEGRRGR